MADRVLLLRRRARPSCASQPSGTNDRVVAEPAARPRGSVTSVPSHVPSAVQLAAVGPRDRGDAPVARGALARRGRPASASSSARGSRASVASSPGVPRRARPGRAAERVDLDPRVVGDAPARRAPRRPRAPSRARSRGTSRAAPRRRATGRRASSTVTHSTGQSRADRGRSRGACARSAWRSRCRSGNAHRAHAERVALEPA